MNLTSLNFWMSDLIMPVSVKLNILLSPESSHPLTFPLLF